MNNDIKEAHGLEVVGHHNRQIDSGPITRIPLVRLSDATAVIDQLREELAKSHEYGYQYRQERNRAQQELAALKTENEALMTQSMVRGERLLEFKAQEPAHWRAVLCPNEMPSQLNPHEHVVGFTDKTKAEEWVHAKLTIGGWNYTLEPLYAAPVAKQEVKLPEPFPAHNNPLSAWDAGYESGYNDALELVNARLNGGKKQ